MSCICIQAFDTCYVAEGLPLPLVSNRKQQSDIFSSHNLPQINSPSAGGNSDHEHSNTAKLATKTPNCTNSLALKLPYNYNGIEAPGDFWKNEGLPSKKRNNLFRVNPQL